MRFTRVHGRCHAWAAVSAGMLSGYRVLGFDLETTGFDYRSDRIVQFALIGSDVDGSHINLQSLIDPRVPIPPSTTQVHGITDDDVRGVGEFNQHVADISSMIEDSIIVGHNVVQFDWRFLEMECMRAGVEAPRPRAIIDTLVLARRLGIPGRHTLGHLCERFEIGMDRSHQADVDAAATLLLLWRILEAYQEKAERIILELI